MHKCIYFTLHTIVQLVFESSFSFQLVCLKTKKHSEKIIVQEKNSKGAMDLVSKKKITISYLFCLFLACLIVFFFVFVFLQKHFL